MDRRTREGRLLVGRPLEPRSVTPSNEVAVDPEQETIDGIFLDHRIESRCHVCSADSETRELVDQLIVRGEPYKQILHAISPLQAAVPDDRKISYHSIRRHQMRHLGADELAIRMTLERRAREQGKRIALGDSPIITNSAALELIRNAGIQTIIQSRRTPNVRETIQATLALAELEKADDEGLEAAEVNRQVRILLQLVRKYLPDDQWAPLIAEFHALVDGDRTLAAWAEEGSS